MKDDTEETKDLFDLMENMLRLDPERRITIEDVFKHPFFERTSQDKK